MDNEEQLTQFVRLCEGVQMINLSTEKDTIVWNLTANGAYTTRSAYEARFLAKTE